MTARRERRAGRVFDAAQADVEVAARRRRVDAREANLDEARRAAKSRPEQLATSTSKPTTRDGSCGSASTNGAPPSASPPHRSSAADCAGPRRDTAQGTQYD